MSYPIPYCYQRYFPGGAGKNSSSEIQNMFLNYQRPIQLISSHGQDRVIAHTAGVFAVLCLRLVTLWTHTTLPTINICHCLKDLTVSPSGSKLGPVMCALQGLCGKSIRGIIRPGETGEGNTKLRTFKSREIIFIYNICLCYPIALKFCTEHGGDTAMFVINFRKDQTTKREVMDNLGLTRFRFKTSFVQLSYNETSPSTGFWYSNDV